MNKVFSLVLQEERQRNVTAQTNSGGVETTNTLAFVTRTNNGRKDTQGSSSHSGFNRNTFQKKERPFCTHCNFHGHTIERCYKIHGYPPGYKPRPKTQTGSTQFSANQISAHSVTQSNHDSGNVGGQELHDSGNVGGFIQSLNSNQYQQLMTMLSSHLASSIPTPAAQDNATVSYATGTCFLVPLKSVSHSNHFWIVDSGATRHICSNANLFTSLKPIWTSTVSLPNNTKIPVRLYGDIHLTPHFILKNVLFVP